MADEKKLDRTTLLPVTAVLAILASLFLGSLAPYQDERPSSRHLQEAHYKTAQDIEARLWQDPFVAISNAIDSEKNNSDLSDLKSHNAERIFNIFNGPEEKELTILAVTLPSGSYQEASEQRMRRRYAVLSGLANQRGFPQDEQHIGYFHPEPKEMSLQERVPFEWWSNDKRNVLLLWVDESSLQKNPNQKLKELLCQVSLGKKTDTNQILYRVIGPNTSTILLDMLKEVKNEADQCTNNDIVYFSAGATASDDDLLDNIKDKSVSVSDYLYQRKVKLYRTIASDDVMMDTLKKELELRQIDPNKHIVILSESDTFYGRAMPKYFEKVWHTDKVHPYSYMRGLDGRLPDKTDNTNSTTEKKSDSKDKSDSETQIELPEGQNQKDYLRRLATQIFELDQKLKATGDPKGVAAIGILGSDVHDKLMILEALRPRFQHRLFFTTDLDAIYSHQKKLPQTHNLLVVSAFDLKLREKLQNDIPPFRDSYQTSFFLTTQMVLNYETNNTPNIEDSVKEKLPPRLFEIGRSRPIPLPVCPQNLSTASHEGCSQDIWSAENTWQPSIINNNQVNLTWKIKIGVLLLLLIVIPPCVSWKVRSHRRLYIGGILALVLFWVLVCYWWNSYYINQWNAEPFYWLEGVSIWPSQLLRFLILPFAGSFFFWGNKRIKKMLADLTHQYPPAHLLDADDRHSFFALPAHGYRRPRNSDFSSFFVESWKLPTGATEVVPDNLWKEYLYCLFKRLPYFCFSGFWLRVCIYGAMFLGVAGLLIMFNPPNVPTRDHDISSTIHYIILASAIITTIMLTMWVVENARLCEQLIDNLSKLPSKWNDNAKDWASSEKIADECVNDWLDIQLVVRLTKTLQPLIWGPMVCIFLLVLARNSIIDDWDIPWELMVVLTVMLIYAIYAEILLQRGAEIVRTKAIEQLSKKIREQRNNTTPSSNYEIIIKRIESEIENIKLLRDGAFNPWYEWSLLQSLGGFSSIVVMLQYWIE